MQIPKHAADVLVAIYDHSDQPLERAGVALKFLRKRALISTRVWRGYPALTTKGAALARRIANER